MGICFSNDNESILNPIRGGDQAINEIDELDSIPIKTKKPLITVSYKSNNITSVDVYEKALQIDCSTYEFANNNTDCIVCYERKYREVKICTNIQCNCNICEQCYDDMVAKGLPCPLCYSKLIGTLNKEMKEIKEDMHRQIAEQYQIMLDDPTKSEECQNKIQFITLFLKTL